jgi:hypothetical protein
MVDKPEVACYHQLCIKHTSILKSRPKFSDCLPCRCCNHVVSLDDTRQIQIYIGDEIG